MKEPEPMFKNAKKGDRFYSLRFGYCIIEVINDAAVFCVLASPVDSINIVGMQSFTLSGYFSNTDKTRDAYWAKPEITERVPKVVEGWINCAVYNSIYKTKEEALSARSNTTSYYGEPCFIHHEYCD